MSLWGDGLLDRARSTSLALLGLTAAVGLALIAYVAQQGWPLLPSSPIPSITSEHGAIHDAEVAAPVPGSGARKSTRRDADTVTAAPGSSSTAAGAAPARGQGGSPPPSGSTVGKTDTVAAQHPGSGSAPSPSPAPS